MIELITGRVSTTGMAFNPGNPDAGFTKTADFRPGGIAGFDAFQSHRFMIGTSRAFYPSANGVDCSHGDEVVAVGEHKKGEFRVIALANVTTKMMDDGSTLRKTMLKGIRLYSWLAILMSFACLITIILSIMAPIWLIGGICGLVYTKRREKVINQAIEMLRNHVNELSMQPSSVQTQA